MNKATVSGRSPTKAIEKSVPMDPLSSLVSPDKPHATVGFTIGK